MTCHNPSVSQLPLMSRCWLAYVFCVLLSAFATPPAVNAGEIMHRLAGEKLHQ